MCIVLGTPWPLPHLIRLERHERVGRGMQAAAPDQPDLGEVQQQQDQAREEAALVDVIAKIAAGLLTGQH